MLRILIVDDEPVIVNSLYQLIGESELDVEVSRSYHAYEALEVMRTKRIDLMISDIRMPGLSGIELQRQVMASWPYCRIIFLTGYDQFDYAQEAIRGGGVLDYVLKHQPDDSILATITRAVQEISANRSVADRAVETAARLQQTMHVLQRELLRRLLLGAPGDAQEAAAELAGMDMAFDFQAPMLLVMALTDDWEAGQSARDRELLLYACVNIMEEYLTEQCRSVSLQVESEAGHRLVWLIQPEAADLAAVEEGWASLASRLPDIVEAVQSACDRWLKVSLSFAIGSERCLARDAAERLSALAGLFPTGPARRRQWLIRESAAASMALEDERDARVTRTVQRLQRFIESRLHEDLSLSRLAELVHHSPTYLSRIYKQVTGESLSAFIAERRMELARHLLLESNMKIYEIAVRIGYDSAPHFTRFFKKKYGITPQEYREG